MTTIVEARTPGSTPEALVQLKRCIKEQSRRELIIAGCELHNIPLVVPVQWAAYRAAVVLMAAAEARQGDCSQDIVLAALEYRRAQKANTREKNAEIIARAEYKLALASDAGLAAEANISEKRERMAAAYEELLSSILALPD